MTRPNVQTDDIESFYRDIDEQVDRLVKRQGARLRCGLGCSTCCVDDLTVFAVEAGHIARHHLDLLDSGLPHDPGACAFLDDAGRCRIYQHRPYVCRTQGLPLRWVDKDSDGNVVEKRDICPLNEQGTAVEELPTGDCWAIGPFEERLSEMQHRDGTEMIRVRLRTLFRKRSPNK